MTRRELSSGRPSHILVALPRKLIASPWGVREMFTLQDTPWMTWARGRGTLLHLENIRSNQGASMSLTLWRWTAIQAMYMLQARVALITRRWRTVPRAADFGWPATG